jgi:rod shape-determining protein MreB
VTTSELIVGPRLALDLGTARTRLASPDGRLRLEAPSSVESVVQGKESQAAKRRLEWPVVHGVVVDVEAVARLLAPMIRDARGAVPFKPRILVCHPSDASQEERDRLVAAVLMAGAGGVRLAAEPVAALLGAAGNGGRPWPRLIVDLGEGVTDIALVHPDRLLMSAAVRLGLAELRQGVSRAVADEQGIVLKTDEIIQLLDRQADSPAWQAVERAPSRRRRSRQRGRRELRHVMLVRSALITRVIEGALDAIGRSASVLFGSLDRRDRQHVASDGILIVGGGGLVPDLGAGIARRLGVPVYIAPDPLAAVIEGARRLLGAGPDDEWLTSLPRSLAFAAGS